VLHEFLMTPEKRATIVAGQRKCGAFNLFNANTNQVEYFYTSRLPGEPVTRVDDRHVHPVELLAVRMTLAAQF
jgi:hypothetical protein